MDFFDHQVLAESLADALEQRARLEEIRHAARRTIIERYDLESVCLPRQVALVTAKQG